MTAMRSERWHVNYDVTSSDDDEDDDDMFPSCRTGCEVGNQKKAGQRRDSTHLYDDSHFGTCLTKADVRARGSTQVINSMEDSSLEFKSRILKRARDVAYRARLHDIALLRRQLIDIKETTLRVMPLCDLTTKQYPSGQLPKMPRHVQQSLTPENKRSILNNRSIEEEKKFEDKSKKVRRKTLNIRLPDIQGKSGSSKSYNLHRQAPIKNSRTRNIMRTLERLYRDRSSRQVKVKDVPISFTQNVPGDSEALVRAKHTLRCNEHTRHLQTTPKS